jgi:hypothetical protein
MHSLRLLTVSVTGDVCDELTNLTRAHSYDDLHLMHTEYQS